MEARCKKRSDRCWFGSADRRDVARPGHEIFALSSHVIGSLRAATSPHRHLGFERDMFDKLSCTTATDPPLGGFRSETATVTSPTGFIMIDSQGFEPDACQTGATLNSGRAKPDISSDKLTLALRFYGCWQACLLYSRR